MFPSLADDIARVRADPSFLLTDLVWIADTLKTSVRLTVDADIYSTLREWYPWLRRDIMFGCQPARSSAHLYFSWSAAAAEDRRFGHYDLLVPCSEQKFDLMLIPDVPRLALACPTETSRYSIYLL